MRKILICCAAVLALGVPAFAAVDFFPVTIDGTFGTHRQEGYGNYGRGTQMRLGKANQQLGYFDWDGSVGDISQESLSDFIANNGGYVANAYLYVRAISATAIVSDLAVITLRTGNTGNLVSDAATNYGQSHSAPAGGVAGASEAPAWRMGPTPYAFAGDFAGGTPWKMPSTADGSTGFAAGQDIVWTDPDNGVTGGIGLDGPQFSWAIMQLLGYSPTQADNTIARIEAAGQLVNKDAADNPILFGPSRAVGTEDPRNKNNATTDDWWYKLPLTEAIVLDIANNPENKGLVFWNYTAYTTSTYDNNQVYSSSASANTYCAYIALEVVPEPATLILLGLGTLGLLRRRAA